MEQSFLSRTDAAVRNRNNIIHYIKKNQPLSRTDIWEAMNMSRASVTQIIRQLLESDLVLETEFGQSTGGRRPQYLVFHGSSRKFYAFDWMTQRLSLMDLDGKLLCEARISLDQPLQPGAFAAAVAKGIQAMEKKTGTPRESVVGLCLALPGLVDSRNGVCIYSIELNWQNVNLRDLFHQVLDLDIFVERTSNMLALGYSSMEHKDDPTHLQLFLLGDEGIGVSTVIHGNCQHGAHCMHGELGHIKTQSDVICSCGQQGCLEAVIKDLLTKSGGEITSEVLDYLSIGVATSINLTDSSYILLVGSYIDRMTFAQKEYLTKAIRNKITGQHLRRLELQFSRETKALSLQGMCTYTFECCFPAD